MPLTPLIVCQTIRVEDTVRKLVFPSDPSRLIEPRQYPYDAVGSAGEIT